MQQQKNNKNDLTLVLIHGAGGNYTNWPLALRKLPGINVVALDLPGHGRSKGQGFDSVNTYADFVANFVTNLNLQKVVLVGHSMGGAIALHLAFQKQDWLCGLVLLGTGAKLKVSSQLMELLKTHSKNVSSFLSKNLFSVGAYCNTPLLISESKKQLRKINPKVLLGDFIACDGFDVRDGIKEIKIPTLIIVGEKDVMTPVSYAQFLAENIPAAKLEIIKDAGHMVMLEKPAEVSKLILNFYSTIIPAYPTTDS